MNTTFSKNLWLLLIAVVFISCAKNGGDINPDTGSDNGLSGELLLVEEKKNGQTLLKFEYDERNRAIVMHITAEPSGEIFTTTFTYDNRDRLIAVDRLDGEAYLHESYTYEGDDDRPATGAWTGADDAVVLVQYAYTENTVIETLSHEGGTQTFTYTFDAKGNQVTALIGPALQEYGDYDDKKSTYTNYPWAWKVNYVNNPGYVKIGTIIDQIWEYTYNEAGYPVSANVYNRGSDEVVEFHEYSYKPAN